MFGLVSTHTVLVIIVIMIINTSALNELLVCNSMSLYSRCDKAFARNKYLKSRASKLKDKRKDAGRNNASVSQMKKISQQLEKARRDFAKNSQELYANSGFANDLEKVRKNLVDFKESIPKNLNKIFNIIEDIILHMVSLSGVDNPVSAFTIIISLVKKLVGGDEALTSTVMRSIFGSCTVDSVFEYFSNISQEFSESVVPDEKLEEMQETLQSNGGKFVNTWLTRLFDGMQLCRNSMLIHKIVKLISILVATGLVGQSKKLHLSYAGMQIFSVAAAKEAATGSSIFDLIECAVQVCHLFVSKLYVCFERRSLMPMFLDNYGGDAYWTDLAEIQALADDHLMGAKVSRWPHHGAFMAEIEKTIIDTERLISMSKDVEKRVLKDQLVKLKKYQQKGFNMEGDGKLRHAPYAFCVSGPSSCGKTTITANLIDFALKRIAFENNNPNFETLPKHICMINELDQYDTNYKAYTLACWEDDMANTNFEKSKGIPTDNAIRYINNASAKAVKAELEEKGKIDLQPLIYAATTNVPEKWAAAFSNAPESALRRYPLHIHAKIRPEWIKHVDNLPDGIEISKLDHGALVKLANGGNFHPDAWIFDVYEFLPVTKGTKFNKITEQCECIKVVKTFNNPQTGKKMSCEGIGLHDLFDLIEAEIKIHLEVQNSVVKANEGLYKEKLCPHGRYTACCKECAAQRAHDLMWDDDIEEDPELVKNSWAEREEQLSDAEQEFYTSYEKVKLIRKNPFFLALTIIPESVATNPFIVWLHHITKNAEIVEQSIYGYIAVYAIMWMWFLFFNTGIWFVFAIHVLLAVLIGCVIKASYVGAYKTICKDRLIMRQFVKNTQQLGTAWSRYITLGCAGLLGFFSIVKLWKVFRRENPVMDNAGMVNDNSTPNEWLTRKNVPLSDYLPVNSQFKNLKAAVSKYQVIVKYLHDEVTFSNGLIVDSGELLIPRHEALRLDNTALEILNANPGTTNGTCHVTPPLSKEDWVTVGEDGTSDVALVAVASLGKRHNLKEFFSENHEMADKMLLTGVYRSPDDFKVREENVAPNRFGPCKTKGGQTYFKYGTYYNNPEPSFRGKCMASNLYVHASRSFIHSFHLAGENTVGGVQCAQMVTKGALEKASEILHANSSHPRIVRVAPIKVKQYGVDFTPVPKPEIERDENGNLNLPKSTAAKCHLTNLDHQKGRCQAAYIGTLPQGYTAPKSSVVDSPIKKEVLEVCGIEDQYGPPPNCRRDENGKRVIPEWEPYRKYLEGVGNATQEFPTKILNRAIDSYHTAVDNLVKDDEVREYASHIKPLNEVEVVSGQDGVKFVDAMKPGTSTGWPLNTPKKNYLRDLLQEDYPEHMCPRTLEKQFFDSAEENKSMHARGFTANWIFKNCTKDEPTKLDKMKARVFQAAPLDAQIEIRELFLPVAAFMSRYPLEFECAVGINSQGPQWDKLMKHVSKFGKERMVAGDFKAYDQHMSGRMILIALNLMADIAERYMDYNPEDIRLMRNMSSDIAFPLVSINGDLTQLFGSNPSGQNLTVYVNSIVNSLYQRCVFYTIYPECKVDFQDVVALSTYGDDNVMSSHSDYPEYNHTRMMEVYADRDIVFTMAQKDSDSVPFIGMDKLEYLKRWSRFDAELQSPLDEEPGMFIAMLDEASIFKSLTCNLKSKTESQESVACQCIDTALREWFFHGPDVFAKRHKQMLEIVQRKGWENWVPPSVFHGYEKRKADWMNKYGITCVEC